MNLPNAAVGNHSIFRFPTTIPYRSTFSARSIFRAFHIDRLHVPHPIHFDSLTSVQLLRFLIIPVDVLFEVNHPDRPQLRSSQSDPHTCEPYIKRHHRPPTSLTTGDRAVDFDRDAALSPRVALVWQPIKTSMNCHIAQGRSLGIGDHMVARPAAEVGRVELHFHTHRALAGLRGFLGSPAILSLRGRHAKWGGRRAFCHSTTVAIPSTSTNCRREPSSS